MKKLLLGALFAALCVSDASASVFQTKSSKSNIDTTLKSGMGTCYKGMASLANSLLVGWADSLSYSAKDPEFSVCKKELNTASKKLSAVAKFTKSILNRDRDSGITKNANKAKTALVEFNTAMHILKYTDYWKHCGAQLRFSVIVVTNALRSMAYPSVEFNAAGAKCSSINGLIDGNGANISNNLANGTFDANGTQVSALSKAAVIINEAEAGYKEVSEAVTPVTNVATATATVPATATQTTSVPAQSVSTTPSSSPSTSSGGRGRGRGRGRG